MWVNWRPQCHCKQISHSTVLLLYTSFGTAIFKGSMHKYFFCTFINHDTYTCDLFASQVMFEWRFAFIIPVKFLLS